MNQRPGTGSNQAPRQSGANTGDDEMGTVHPVDDGFSYPSVSALVTVTVTPIP